MPFDFVNSKVFEITSSDLTFGTPLSLSSIDSSFPQRISLYGFLAQVKFSGLMTDGTNCNLSISDGSGSDVIHKYLITSGTIQTNSIAEKEQSDSYVRINNGVFVTIDQPIPGTVTLDYLTISVLYQ